MKIKVKKQLNLLDLIEHIKKKNIVSKVFDNTEKRGSVIVSIEGDISIYTVNLSDTFAVEVEKEITEKTNIPNLLEVYKNDFGNLGAQLHQDKTIKDVLKLTPSRFKIEKFYIINDDMTMTLIWKDGEMSV
ncbi:hypothetical protein [Staphylococcus felis]|uniref:Uncharacterized protein n=1 Tax=Staphylococcus felis TaxID=46127 RepID=A0ABS0QSZ4_9STAP|nr:hypothetical protein [Staphylococcus felis]MBH9582139.1 hypothetical protein [Staphylococcus felis]